MVKQKLPFKVQPKRGGSILFIFVLLVAGVALWMPERPFIEIGEDGVPRLAPWRKEKLKRELKEMEEAEQYVLKAGVPGYYPCYNCGMETQIYLHLNEVWRYGTTTKKMKGRYKGGLPIEELVYLIEFEGPLQKCLELEKEKIYHYALLPENLNRTRPLMRPPGNKIDR